MSNIMLAVRGARWAQAIWLLVALIVVIIVALWDTASSMVGVWEHSTTFNHGFIIPLITLWLIWAKRHELRMVVPRANVIGLVGMLGAGVLWLAGEVASVQVAQHFALIFMIQAAVLAIWGWQATRLLLFPIGYLLFAVPFGEFLTSPLQDFTASFAVRSLEILGIPVFSDGVFISIPEGNFEVAEACAGLRFLIATLAVGALFSYLFYRGIGRRLIFLVLSFVIPVIGNGFRALGTILVGHYIGMQYAGGVDHLFYGWIFFAAILLLLIFVGSRFSDKPLGVDPAMVPKDATERPVRSLTLATYAAVGMLLAVSGPAYAQYIRLRGEQAFVQPQIPAAVGSWQANSAAASSLGWAPHFLGASREAERVFVNANGQAAAIYMAIYDTQHQGAELINKGNDLSAGAAKWKRSGSGRLDLPGVGQTAYVQLTNLQDQATVYYWYWVDDQVVTNDLRAKLLYAKAAFLGGNPASGVVAVMLRDGLTREATQESVMSLISALPPLEQLFVSSQSEETGN